MNTIVNVNGADLEIQNPSRKRFVAEFQEHLDQEAADGHVNTGAYARLSKQLKTAYERYTPVSDNAFVCIYGYLIEQFMDHPESAAIVPQKLRGIVDTPKFVRELIATRIKRSKDAGEDEDGWRGEWLSDFFKGMFPADTMLDEEYSDFDRPWFQKVVLCLLEARRDLVEPLMKHMDDVDVYPSHAVAEIGHGRTDADNLPKVLTHEPRFLWWLLNPGTVDDFTYHPWEVAMLQQHAYDHRAKTLDQRNPKFLGALGLRGIGDLKECEALTTLSHPPKTFASAKAVVLAKPYVWNTVPDDTPPDPAATPRPSRNDPYSWQI
ncbi:MAG: hypothetical protein CMB11_08365 [Euryarchaeota archaeon]|nr:hypothetical protein [Euryarchaeota archaeon]